MSDASTNTADQGVFGYYTHASASEPAFDPGRVPCPVCGLPWDDDTVRTISFSDLGDRSYFYRIHRACDTPAATQAIESRVIDRAQASH